MAAIALCLVGVYCVFWVEIFPILRLGPRDYTYMWEWEAQIFQVSHWKFSIT